MKYIKKFEKITEEMSNLKIGDILICNIKDEYYVAKYGQKYIICDIKGLCVRLKTLNNEILKYPKSNWEHPNKVKYFYIGYFMTETEWTANKYNL